MTATPPPHGLRVLLAGASGLIGAHCLELLLADEAIAAVIVLARQPLGRVHPKLCVQVLDFENLRDQAPPFAVDVALCCLGTTQRAAGSPEAFAHVDHIYVAELARLAAARGAQRFVMVSAVGADPASPVLYNRVKGRAEAAVSELPFRSVHLLRPSLLLGERRETRPLEDWSKLWAPLWSWLLCGPLRRYRPTRATDVAARMVALAKDESDGVQVHYFTA